jgi:hypothetical protein
MERNTAAAKSNVMQKSLVFSRRSGSVTPHES